MIIILEKKPDFGIHLGHGIYKIRIGIKSKRVDKSSGARVITFFISNNKEVYLVYIYDKSQLNNITKDQIIVLLKNAELL